LHIYSHKITTSKFRTKLNVPFCRGRLVLCKHNVWTMILE